MNYDTLDLDFSWDGDLVLGSDGDLGDNRDDGIRSLENEIRTVVKSEMGDWQHHPSLGANLSEFRGEPNTREIGKKIEQRVVSSLTNTGIVRLEDLKVRVVPTSVHAILIIITVTAQATPYNRLSQGESIVVSLSYDSLEDSVFFLPPSRTEWEGR